jgi:hypothetical protein
MGKRSTPVESIPAGNTDHNGVFLVRPLLVAPETTKSPGGTDSAGAFFCSKSNYGHYGKTPGQGKLQVSEKLQVRENLQVAQICRLGRWACPRWSKQTTAKSRKRFSISHFSFVIFHRHFCIANRSRPRRHIKMVNVIWKMLFCS